MRIGIWQHPRNTRVRRAYFNDLPFLSKGEKAYVQPNGDGVQLSVATAYRADLEGTLLDVGLLADGDNIEDVPFAVFEQYAAAQPAAQGRGAAKKPGSSPSNRSPARSRPSTRLSASGAGARGYRDLGAEHSIRHRAEVLQRHWSEDGFRGLGG